jgi:hypothetical protein
MRIRYPKLPILGAALAVLLAGCGSETSEAPAALAPAEVPKTVEAAFATAPAETRKAVTEITADISANPDMAVQGLEQFSKRPDLSAEQREATAQAMAAAIAELQKAAASGDPQAKEALEARAARK